MKLNLPIAFASLILSLMLWFVAYAQNMPTPSPITAPLALDGLDEGRYFIRKAPTDVRIVVSGPAERIQTMREERVTTSVDLSQPKLGVHDYPVAISPTWVAPYLVGSRPTVRISIEPVGSRQLTVTPVLKGTLRDRDLQILDRRVSPTKVTVRGPQSEVDSIREARAYLDLSAVDPEHPDTQDAVIVPLDEHETSPAHVRATPSVVVAFYTIGAAASSKPALVVPNVQVSYAPGVVTNGYAADPPSVNLTGKPAILANVSKIPTEPILDADLQQTHTYRVRLLPPAGTSIQGSPYVRVTVKVRPAPAVPPTASGASGTPSNR